MCQGRTRAEELWRGGARSARIHGHVDERSPKLPLADDPSFLASLSALDQGVIEEHAAAVRSAPQSQLPRTARRPAPAGPPRLTPEGAAALAAASAALAAFDTRPVTDHVEVPEPSASRDPVPRDTPSAPAAEPALKSAAVDASPSAFQRRRWLLIVLLIALVVAGLAAWSLLR